MTLFIDEPNYLATELASRVEQCGLGFDEVEMIIGVSAGAFPRSLPVLDREREGCMRRLNQLCALVIAIQPDDCARWFRSPIAALGSLSPIDLMMADAQAVGGLLERLRQENMFTY